MAHTDHSEAVTAPPPPPRQDSAPALQIPSAFGLKSQGKWPDQSLSEEDSKAMCLSASFLFQGVSVSEWSLQPVEGKWGYCKGKSEGQERETLAQQKETGSELSVTGACKHLMGR